MIRIPEGSAPDLKNRSWQITADVKVPASADGVIMTQGGRFNGAGLYLLKGKPVFHYNYLALERTSVASTDALPPGDHKIEVKFAYAGGGPGKPADVSLLVDGKEVATGHIEKAIPNRLSLDETLDIGEDAGTPVSEDYHVPFRFTGDIGKVRFDLK